MASAFTEAIFREIAKLLQRLLNSNSHGNGHADHGVVTCAQEAHQQRVAETVALLQHGERQGKGEFQQKPGRLAASHI